MEKNIFTYIQQYYPDFILLEWPFAFLVFFLFAFLIINVLAIVAGLATYAERKISADIQARIGPNRVGPYGLLQFLADGVKMILKEDIIPEGVDKLLFKLAPLLCLIGVFFSTLVLPFSEFFVLFNSDVGVFYLLGLSTLIGVGIFLGGYSSNSKWSLLGGMRSASQIVSYEIPMTIVALTIVLLGQGLSLSHLTSKQGIFPWNWYLFHNPFTFISFFVYFVAGLAETNRAPFDLPEAESELVSGYHTEYSGMRFAFFALAEYIEVFVLCALAVVLFLGGNNAPSFGLDPSHLFLQFLQTLIFFLKTFLLYYIVIWVRWTLPRLRVDQLMSLCWKYLTPIALFNLVGCAIWIWIFKGKSIGQICLSFFGL